MGKSFQLIRTNPRLTTNYKVVVDSSYNLYLESFNSSKELNDDKYKHYLLSRDTMLENDVPKFYDKLPKKLAYSPRTDNDVNVMYDTYNNQFDETYFSGADEVEDTWYTEEFEYFAPLYVIKNELPSNFIIMRIDEPNIYEKTGSDYSIGTLNKDNFREEIIDKWKCTKVFNLSNETLIGKFFDRNINNNDRFPDFSFFFDTKKYNYSKWAGLEYTTGVYRTAELFLDDKLFYENPHFNLEEFITKGFEENGIIYPYILNLKFLFDDSPATPNEFLKYSMNRYYGFYTDELELVKTITSYDLPDLKTGLSIKNNIFLDGSGSFINPFVSEYIKNDWIQIGNEFFEVRQQSNGSFKIISDKNLTGYDISEFNNGFALININEISDFGTIDDFISSSNQDENMYADLYLIEINGEYHVLKNNYTKSVGVSGETVFTNNYFIQSDYSISSNNDILEYFKGGTNSNFHVQKEVKNEDGSPLYYSIYRVKFADIKDFDFDRINTSYSDFDYEKSTYVNTLEEKLYATEYRDNSVPKRKKLHGLNQDGQYSLMNISSEYTAGDETFELRKNDKINPLWEKNQSICKWEYRGSISHSDYPYKLNNSKEFGGVYNRITNTELKKANLKEKNLDYFYRIGNFYGAEDIPILESYNQTTWETQWTGTTSTWNWNSGNNWYEGDLNTAAINQNISLTIGKDYYIYVRLVSVGPAAGADTGIHPDSFSNMTTTITNQEVVLEGIRKANGTTLKIFTDRTGVGVVGFYEVYIYDITNRYYLNQSTNIQTDLFNYLDSSIDNRFNLDYYINSDFDYFDFFFNNIMYYEDYGQLKQRPFLKYATFGGGDGDLPATALFKGVEYSIYKVEDIVLDSPVGGQETIRNIITDGGVNFNGYKMAVILSENYNYYTFDKEEVEIIEEDIVPSDYNSFSDFEITGSTNNDFGWRQNGNFLEWFWDPDDDDPTRQWSVKIKDPDISTDPQYTYDITFTFAYDISGWNFGSARVYFKFGTYSFSDVIDSGTTYIFDEDYDMGINIFDSTTFTLTDVTPNIDGEMKLEFEWSNEEEIDYGDRCFMRISDINVNRKSTGTDFANPEFQYSYNTSIDGLLDNQDKNGLHVYLNEKYENMLVIINKNIPINLDWVSLNNVDEFGENYGLYYGKTLNGFNLFPVTGTSVSSYNPDDITAFNYMSALNNLNTKGLFDTYVHYHYIDENANYAKTQMIKFNNSTFEDLPNWDEKFPPFIIEVDGPLDLSLKKNSYTRRALDKPNTNIKDKFLIFDNGAPLSQSVIDEPLAREITINEVDQTYRKKEHGETTTDTLTIKRFVGYYEPLFKNIPMYRPIYYWKDGDNYFSVGSNYVFADNLEQFAKIDELMYSKVNNEINVLKLKNTDNDISVYPMLDEIGLSQTDRFIFLSSWDNEFFLKTLNETTFLEEFITTDLEDPTVPIYAQITGVNVLNPTSYFSGINIYGSDIDSSNLSFELNIKNLGTTSESFDWKMKYISNLNITGELSGGTISSLAPNATSTIPISYSRPQEQNFGVPYYEEFTRWKIFFEVYDTDGNELDTNDNTTFDVYNDLINFDLSNATVTDGFASPHYVGDKLNYTIDVDETNNRLTNISYIARLYMETGETSGVYDLLSTITGTMTNSTTLYFNNINTPTYDLDYNSSENRNIKFEIFHQYDIEGITQTTGDTYIATTGLTVNRLPEPPNLQWKNPTTEPTITMINGGCDYIAGEYNGDEISGSTATIINYGGTFNGSITVTFYWRADAVNIGAKSVTWSGILNKNDEKIFTASIGPLDQNGDPYITYTNKNYTIKAVTNRISGSIVSEVKQGYNASYPDCTL